MKYNICLHVTRISDQVNNKLYQVSLTTVVLDTDRCWLTAADNQNKTISKIKHQQQDLNKTKQKKKNTAKLICKDF